jgi:hypothetical protein
MKRIFRKLGGNEMKNPSASTGQIPLSEESGRQEKMFGEGEGSRGEE